MSTRYGARATRVRVDWMLAALALALPGCDDAPAPADADADADADAGTDADADVEDDALDADLEHEADAEADADGDADAEARRRGGYVVATERSTGDGEEVESAVMVRFYYPRPVIWCGYDFEFFGDCYIFTVHAPACENPCEDGHICAWDEGCTMATCVEAVDPAALFDAGDVTIEGAAHQDEVTCSFVDGEYACDVDAAGDFWDAGDELLVSAPGVTFPGFAVELVAPPQLELTTDTSAWTPATFDGSAPVVIEWDATERGAAIEIDIDAGTTGLTCLAADTGSFEVPAAALTALGAADAYSITALRSNGGIDHEAEDGEVKVYAESAAAEVLVE